MRVNVPVTTSILTIKKGPGATAIADAALKLLDYFYTMEKVCYEPPRLEFTVEDESGGPDFTIKVTAVKMYQKYGRYEIEGSIAGFDDIPVRVTYWIRKTDGDHGSITDLEPVAQAA